MHFARYTKKIANSPGLLALTFCGSMLLAALMYRVSEGTTYLDSIYWALVTATTLGYGDFSPHTLGGKLLTSGLISFTVFVLIPTITANVASWLIVNRDEWTHDEQEQIKLDLQRCIEMLQKMQPELHGSEESPEKSIPASPGRASPSR